MTELRVPNIGSVVQSLNAHFGVKGWWSHYTSGKGGSGLLKYRILEEDWVLKKSPREYYKLHKVK